MKNVICSRANLSWASPSGILVGQVLVG